MALIPQPEHLVYFLRVLEEIRLPLYVTILPLGLHLVMYRALYLT